LKFENDNIIFEKYKDLFILLDEIIDKSFTDKYKSFIDEYGEEYDRIINNQKNWLKRFLKYIFRKKHLKTYFLCNIII
jgi:hypothetical protein